MATKNIVGHLVYKVTGDSKELDTSLKGSQDRVAKFSKFVMSALGIGGAVIAIRSLIRIGKDLVAAYGVQEQAENRLAAAIRATGGDVDALMDQYKEFASGIQDVTTVGDEQTLGLLQQAQSLGIARERMEEATRGAIGLSKAFGIDMNTALRGVALAFEGQYTMLNRYIPALRTAGNEVERQKVLQEAMAGGFEIAKAEAESNTGAMLQLQNAIGDLKEIGGGLLLDFLAPSIRYLNEAARQAAEVATNIQRIGRVMKEATAGKGAAQLRADMAALQSEIGRINIALEKGMPVMGMHRKEAEAYVVELQNRLEGLRRQYVKLGGDAKTAGENIVDPFDEAARIVREELYAALSIAERQAAALGDSFDLNKEKIALYEKAIKSLIEQGLDPAWPAVQQLVVALKTLRDATTETIDTSRDFTEVMAEEAVFRQNMIDLDIAMLQARAKAAKESAEAEVKANEEAAAKTESIRQGLSDFITGIWGQLGSVYQQQAARELDIMRRNHDLELESFQGTEEEKAALAKEFQEEEAKVEYEGALRSWKMQLMGGLAAMARAVIESMKLGFPWAIPMVAMAAAQGAIQIAALKAAKPIPQFATGADFIVPPGYPDDSYPMRVESGEHVVVEPKGAATSQQMIHNVVNLDGKKILEYITEASRYGGVFIDSRAVVKR